ncbi:MAG: hypothetical protein OET44_16160 [Gammaproteobacteria bacterium]|nr:hypothetical protein [Gammaproteobacteria bacterium]
MNTQTTRIFFLAQMLACMFAAALLAGCEPGSGQGLDENGNLLSDSEEGPDPVEDPGNGGGGASGNPNATLAWLQANVFGGVCTQCHTGAGAPFGVDWSSDAATCGNLLRPSGEKPELMEIDPGNPARSYLIWKVEGQGPNGEPIELAQMPLANPPLTAETIQNMRDWIADGTPGCQLPSAQLPHTGLAGMS